MVDISQFEVAGGSVRGRDHERMNRNNQDAFAWDIGENYIVAVVCDGCGSGQYSEIGAQIGAQMGVNLLSHLVKQLLDTPENILPQLQTQILEQLRQLSQQMGRNLFETIHNNFLFTFVAAIVTQSISMVFTLGDGIAYINGEVIKIDYPGNAPPYLAYHLIPERIGFTPSFQVHWQSNSENIQEILIGTDGVAEWDSLAMRNLPGKSQLLGTVSQFWSEDRYFSNPRAVERHLALVNRTVNRFDPQQQRLHKEHGLLADDTTLVVIRRKNKE